MATTLQPKIPKASLGGAKGYAKDVIGWGFTAAAIAGGLGLYQVFLKPLAGKVPVAGRIWQSSGAGGANVDQFGTVM